MMKMQLKEAQLYEVIVNNDDPMVINSILEKGVDVNWKIPAHLSYEHHRLDFDCSLLHVAYDKKKINYFKILLDHGTNFTIKNQNGSTVLHYIVEDLQKNQKPNDYSWLLNNPYVIAILSAHVKFANSHNPCDNNGLSHFHIACMTNHIKAVKLFLDNGVSIDQIVNIDYPMKPGYHSLHFIAEFNNFETGELLISTGANMYIKNSNGMTPLHLLIKRRLEMFDAGRSVKKKELADNINKMKELNKRLINLFLENDTSSCDVTDDMGLSNFHVACLLQNSSLVESLLDQVSDIDHAVNSDSPICPGYTGLHFAAHCNFDTVMMLVKKGANLTAKDVKGVTALDVCMRWLKVQEIHSLVASVPKLREIHFSDGKTKLVDCILAMESKSSLKNFLQGCINANIHLPNDSPIWPGCRPLHLAVAFSKNFETINKGDKLVAMCFDHGANIHAQDKHGSTPLHLAFRQGKQQVMLCLFQIYEKDSHKAVNLSDEDGLSYLHMSMDNNDRAITNCARKFLSYKRSAKPSSNAIYKGRPLVNVKPGWTPLHVATKTDNNVMVELLLQHGANFLQKDSQGFTAVHRSLENGKTKSNVFRLFTSTQLEECIVESIGLSYLHVASWFNEAKVVRQLLERESDIEAVVRQSIQEENLAKFSGCRPLHLAIMSKSKEAVRELLEWGADIFAKKPDFTSPLSQALTGKNDKILNLFVILLWNDEELQNTMEKQFGLTMLHIACHVMDVKKVKILLKKGVDVNARTHNNSNIWPGTTPLHRLLANAVDIDSYGKQRINFLHILEVLLENGANVIAMDVRQYSSLSLIFKNFKAQSDYDYGNLLLKYHRDFSINPMDNEGFSYFHLACLMKNVEAVEKFLQQGNVDVNLPINFFAIVYAGYTPLHLVVLDKYNFRNNDKTCNDQQSTVELLMKHGAQIIAQNRSGCTPLHLLFSEHHDNKRRFNLMRPLLWSSNKSNVNIRNIKGKTPMEILLSRYWDDIRVMQSLVDHGGLINIHNPISDEGYIAIGISSRRPIRVRTDVSQIIMNSPEISKLDEVGRNAIHNAVAICNFDSYTYVVISEDHYVALIADFIKLGCNIDHQDNFGRTALHLAMIFRNDNAVFALLALGADFNIVDAIGKTAFSYIFEPCKDKLYWNTSAQNSLLLQRKQSLISIFISYVGKLKFLRIEVSKKNDCLQETIQRKRVIEFVVQSVFIDEVHATRNVKIGGGDLTLRSFLCETGTVNRFPGMTPQARNEVIDFFENINLKEFPGLKYIIKLQYRKALERLALVDPARDSLQTLLSYPLPYLCLDNIIKYLSNSVLRNLISASIEEEDISMIIN